MCVECSKRRERALERGFATVKYKPYIGYKRSDGAFEFLLIALAFAGILTGAIGVFFQGR